jgi:hypothetical protein
LAIQIKPLGRKTAKSLPGIDESVRLQRMAKNDCFANNDGGGGRIRLSSCFIVAESKIMSVICVLNGLEINYY